MYKINCSRHSSPKVVTPVILAIANVSTADDSQVQVKFYIFFWL